MTFEIIIFIASILFGIVWYWRESKNNKLYRFFNKMMHSKELQMKPENRKAFVHQQPFLLRLVWIALLFLITAIVVAFVIPFTTFYLQYFVSAIVGTLIGTYIASLFFVASEGLKKENIEKNFDNAVKKGREFVDDLTEKDEPVPEVKETKKTDPEEEPKKSARDRLKDKGMIN